MEVYRCIFREMVSDQELDLVSSVQLESRTWKTAVDEYCLSETSACGVDIACRQIDLEADGLKGCCVQAAERCAVQDADRAAESR